MYFLQKTSSSGVAYTFKTCEQSQISIKRSKQNHSLKKLFVEQQYFTTLFEKDINQPIKCWTD
jgi:hypothetical protein